MDNNEQPQTFIDVTLEEFRDWCRMKGYYNLSSFDEIIEAFKEFETTR